MSTYSSSRVTIEVRPTNAELLAAALVGRLGPLAQYVPSGELSAVRGRIAAENDPERLVAILAGRELQQAATPTLLAQVGGSLAAGRTLSAHHRRDLENSLMQLEQHTLHAERIGVAAITSTAMRQIGFHVRAIDGELVSGIEARRGHDVVLMAVGAGGNLEIDVVGHGADSCEGVIADVHAALASEGLNVTISRQERHGNPNGGALVDRAAAAADNGDLLTGLIAEAAPTFASNQFYRPAEHVRQRGNT